MAEISWSEPRTEEGLERTLLQLEECRASGNLVQTGYGLLALARLVVWVRSGSETDPFQRAHELAREALLVFREANDATGIVRALVATVAGSNRETTEKLLAEAEALAEDIGDDSLRATVLAARGRAAARTGAPQAAELQHQALAIFQRLSDKGSQARTLFSLMVVAPTKEQKRDYAFEAALLYREIDQPLEAGQCLMRGLRLALEIDPEFDPVPLAKEGIANAIAASQPSQVRHFAEILASRHQGPPLPELTEREQLEEKRNEIEVMKSVIAFSESKEDTEMADMFRKVLHRLESDE